MTSTLVPDGGPRRPVARVLPLLGLPHLDRLFDYLIPPEADADAQPGVRVRIRFNGKLVNGILVERVAESSHDGRLSHLKDVISPEQVYPPQLAKLVESLAQYYGGTRSDIIRTAIPNRHARAERSRNSDSHPSWEELGALPTEPINLDAWKRYAFGGSFVQSILEGTAARAAWLTKPGEQTSAMLAALAVAVARNGGGVLIVVPSQRVLNCLEVALRQFISARQFTVLGASLGPESRYRRYLDILHGQGRIVIGTRSAAYAPVSNLRLTVIVDDGDENLVDPLAPYVHAREVLVTRSAQEKCAFIACSSSRTAEMELLVQSGWAHNLVATQEELSKALPTLIATADTASDPDSIENFHRGRIPTIGYKRAKAALKEKQPVLVQVPRKGYLPTLACRNCGTPARCRWCNGPLGIPESNDGQAHPPTCRWCGRIDVHHHCHNCGSAKIRPTVIGTDRTTEELGRIFSPAIVVNSSGEHIVDEIKPGGRLVVATPGAEPKVEGGYAVTLLLDTWAMLGRQDLRADEDALAKWAHAVSLTRGSDDGGCVIIDADAAHPVVGNFLRWNLIGAAADELAQRREAKLPPAFHMVAVDGSARGLDQIQDIWELPDGVEVLGPVDLPISARRPAGVDEGTTVQRILLRTPRERARELGKRLKQAQSVRGTTREVESVRIIVDPIHFG